MNVTAERFQTSLEYINDHGSSVESIANVIITDLKAHYIASQIKLPIRDMVARNAFTSALLAFDRDTDLIIAKTILDGYFTKTDECNLDGIYDFMLGVLKTRWDEVCLLANDNACYLACQSTFQELLQFLIQSIDCQMDDTMFMHIRDHSTRDNVKKMFAQLR